MKSRRGEWPFAPTKKISLFTIHYSLFTIHYSLFTIHSSLFPTPYTLSSPTPYTLHPLFPMAADGGRWRPYTLHPNQRTT
ncbi:hypothetical protein H6G82_29610 [Planktothricoides sp. FACHB-1261]|nr:hypothetical protein [Planktothricoides raciborskii FACHB-1261]